MKTWMKMGLILACFAGTQPLMKVEAQSFQEKDLVIFGGSGFGPVYARGWGLDTRFPAFQLGAEKGLKTYDQVVISLGAVAGYQFGAIHRNWGDYVYHNYIGAVRIAGHYDPEALIGFKGLDLYLGLQAGPRFEQRVDRFLGTRSLDLRPSLGAVAGGRWWFANSVAVYGEFGYGITWANLGVALKL